MYPFSYQRAAGLTQALAGLKADPQARLLAGGMTLLPSMKHRLAAPSTLLDIRRLAELPGVARDRDALSVCPGTRHGEILSLIPLSVPTRLTRHSFALFSLHL